MDTTQLKNYAPKARRDFIAAVSVQAARFGISEKGIADAQVQGDVLLLGGHAFPKAIRSARTKLVDRVQKYGFEPTIEAIAYTWFNRFVAMRYMELHGYFDHGYRVLSHPDGQSRPEILDHAADVELPGLDRTKVVELKLDGTKDEELFRLLLKAQCNALNKAMPFLFDPIGSETELLLPANLLHTDSLIRQMVESIDESAWGQIEIIGWLYQFYISEKKDQVIGKVVKSEDIPAATQLFTPNWIVKYMVQNSLGAQWLATYPHSPLRGQMEYYIEPAEQTDEVKAQLAAITPSALNPEELTLIDPACGSGHILVEAYELFKAIYLERGYRQRDVAQMILEKNLFGLDIDGRAAQLTGFALMMKGRADDRRLFERGVTLNVMALVNSAGFDAERLAIGVELSDYGLKSGDLTEMRQLFKCATTFGSLIQVPKNLEAKIPALRKLSSWKTPKGITQDWTLIEALNHLHPLSRQAAMLASQYDAVVANPPYIGGKYMNSLMRTFAKDNFPRSKSDLFAVSTERFMGFAKPTGLVGLMTPFTWMFLKSYEELRVLLLKTKTLCSLIQPEYHAFFDSAYVPVCTFVVQCCHTSDFNATFIKLSDFYGADLQPQKTIEAIDNPNCGWLYRAKPDDFKQIPGSPLAFWVSNRMLRLFAGPTALNDVALLREGIHTGDNPRFLRLWQEVAETRTNRSASSYDDLDKTNLKWVPYNKGGLFRRWFGNNEWVIAFDSASRTQMASLRSHVRPSEGIYFKRGATWSAVTSGRFSLRYFPNGFLFDQKGQVLVTDDLYHIMGLLNSDLYGQLSKVLMPTLDYTCGGVRRLPFLGEARSKIAEVSEQAVAISRRDWDSYERSWDFQSLPILPTSTGHTPTVGSCYDAWIAQSLNAIDEMKRLEQENNFLLINAYGLKDELTPDVPIEQITLTVNPAYRYGGKLTEEERWTRFRHDTMAELVSYAIGCMMGRYSLDEPGLIYAHSGNEGFNHGKYATFPADDDGIVPITDTEWFADDACLRLVEFISVAWDENRLEENLTFLADNLSPKKNESSRDTLRRYVCDKFFKDHLKTYKKRPIYWLFSSGKQKAFQCLVYLHRYNEGTLSRMRSEYVIPLQGKMSARLEKLQGDIKVATSTAHQKRLEKERTKLKKQQVELLTFDEKLRHYADRRITLDLDDGVKVNYGKFGTLLGEVKAVHGKKPEGA